MKATYPLVPLITAKAARPELPSYIIIVPHQFQEHLDALDRIFPNLPYGLTVRVAICIFLCDHEDVLLHELFEKLEPTQITAEGFDRFARERICPHLSNVVPRFEERRRVAA